MKTMRTSRRAREAMKRAAEHFEAGEYEEALDQYRTLPLSHLTPEVAADIARVSANLALEEAATAGKLDPRVRRMLDYSASAMETAIGLDESLAETGDYLIGKALLMIDMPNQALPHLTRLAERNPKDAETAQMVAYCNDMLACPTSIPSWRTRVEAAWERFVKVEAEVRERLAEGDDEAAFLLADDALPESVDYEISLTDGSERPVLVLSPRHYRTELFKVTYLADLAPRDVDDSWDIVVGWPATADVVIDTDDGLAIYAADVTVWPEFHGDAVSVEAHSTALAALLETEQGPLRAEEALLQLLDMTVGEVEMMQVLDGYKVLERPRREKGVPLSELRGLVYENLSEVWGDDLGSLLALLDAEFALGGMPSKAPEDIQPGDRSDAFASVSTLPDVIDEFDEGCTDTVDIALADGIVLGYVFIEHTSVGGGTIPTDVMLDLYAEVETALEDATDGSEVSFTGETMGAACVYLDVIVFDFTSFLDAARAVLSSFDAIGAAAFHVFRPGVPSVALKGSYD